MGNTAERTKKKKEKEQKKGNLTLLRKIWNGMTKQIVQKVTQYIPHGFIKKKEAMI
jgi:hypothetical protein